MRLILMIILICTITTIGKAQQWQSIISLGSRVGYSTNSYLTPFLSEWNSSAESGYNLTTLMSQSYWYKNDHSLSLTGGLLYEPVFNQSGSWKGGLALGNYNFRFSDNWSAGVEGGASYFTNSYSRTLGWIQPKVTWFASPFTLFRFKAGSNFRQYQNYGDDTGNSRFDLYGLEFETWPTYRWQFKAGLYGSLDNLPSIAEGFNARSGATYYFKNSASINIQAGLEQYQLEYTEQDGGGPPSGFPPNQPSGTITTDTDRILRFGVGGSYPINEQFSLFASAEALRFESESSNTTANDYEISGGLRFSFEPRLNRNPVVVTPQWQLNESTQQIKIQYSGEGRLYLVGDFNNWNRSGISLREQSDNTYVTQLNLSPGAYEYKVLRIQGDTEEWLTFSNETYTVSDGYGNKNAMLLVE